MPSLPKVEAKQDGTSVRTGVVRLSYVNLAKPRTVGQGDNASTKYSCVLIIPKSDKSTLRAIQAAQNEAATNQNGVAKLGKVPEDWRKSDRFKQTLRDGDRWDLEKNPEYEGCYFMNVSSSEERPPDLVDARVRPITDMREVYSGIYAVVSINAFAYSGQGSKGVSFGLNSVQKVADGEPFGTTRRPEDVFEVIESADDEDADDDEDDFL